MPGHGVFGGSMDRVPSKWGTLSLIIITALISELAEPKTITLARKSGKLQSATAVWTQSSFHDLLHGSYQLYAGCSVSSGLEMALCFGQTVNTDCFKTTDSICSFLLFQKHNN